MNKATLLKLGQVLGVLLLCAGPISCVAHADQGTTSWLFIWGAIIYGGCRLAAWLRADKPAAK